MLQLLWCFAQLCISRRQVSRSVLSVIYLRKMTHICVHSSMAASCITMLCWVDYASVSGAVAQLLRENRSSIQILEADRKIQELLILKQVAQ